MHRASAHDHDAAPAAYSAVAKLQGEWLSGRTLRALAEDGLVDGFELAAHPDVMGFVIATLLLSCSSRAAPVTATAASE